MTTDSPEYHELPSLPTSSLQDVSPHYQTNGPPGKDETEVTPGKDQLLFPVPQSVQHDNAVKRPQSRKLYAIWNSFKLLLLPLVAIAYLTFCYVVHYRIVVLKTNLVDTSVSNLANIKSGVTSISIIIITLGLLPVKSLVSDLKSEEFFRTVNAKPNGVPLTTLDGISTFTFGHTETLLAITKRHSSGYFFTAFVTGLFLIAINTLAPAALSVSTANFDSDIVALAVGAIDRDSIFNASKFAPSLTTSTYDFTTRGANLAWVENQLHIPFSFQADEQYIVPLPIDLSIDTPAKWLSDVVIMKPECTWSAAKLNSSVSNPLRNNSNFVLDLDQGLRLSVDSGLGFTGYADISLVTNMLINQTDLGVPLTGSVVWLLAQCIASNTTDCSNISNEMSLNFTGIPTLDLDVTIFSGKVVKYATAYLLCSPHATIQTREIRNDGKGRLTILDTPITPPQGNLHPAQTYALLTNVLMDLPNTGPLSQFSAMGSESQGNIIFGPQASNVSLPDFGVVTPIAPAPLSNITEGYTRALRSAAKIFMQGAVSKTYVPARLTSSRIIFTSSLPQVIASTIIFVLLLVITFIAQFRKEVPAFTLFSVAAALDRSEIPATFAQVRNLYDVKARLTQEEAVQSFEGTRVVLRKTEDSYGTLHLR
ncbi:hypothetical protein K474DRAFT_1676366 [Panus rudis PR-1116 ss-1]|nr:hypothetical protein K474DRAFT_1676366 [Panus rudis PR-1116 ss-1]